MSEDDKVRVVVALFVWVAHVLIFIVFVFGACVSTMKLFTVSILLWLLAVSVTLIVHALYVQSESVLYVIVLFHATAAVVAEAHHHPYVIVPFSVLLNV